MTNLTVYISQVSDGNMFKRHDVQDGETIINREKFLADRDIAIGHASLLDPSITKREKEEHETNWCRYQELTDADWGDSAQSKKGFIVDAIITRASGHALMLPVADCIGTVFYDEAHHVLMMSHLGRHSLEQNGAIHCVEHLALQYGSQPKDIKVWMTPSASKEVYPIWALDNKGMKEVAFEQLKAAGILIENTTDNPAETDKDPDYFSYTNFYNKRSDVDGDHIIVAVMND